MWMILQKLNFYQAPGTKCEVRLQERYSPESWQPKLQWLLMF